MVEEGSFSISTPPSFRTHSLHSHLVSLNAQSLRLPVQITKASRFHSRKPETQLLCLPSLSASVVRAGEGETAAVLPTGERSLGPLWGPYPREEPGEPDGHPTACPEQCQMGWLWLMACAPVCRPHDLSCRDFLACPSEVTLPHRSPNL